MEKDYRYVRIGAEDKEKNCLQSFKGRWAEDRANEWPSVLSGGQKQRVPLVAHVAGNTKLLLLDEPRRSIGCINKNRNATIN